jgi:hypothetical protein
MVVDPGQMIGSFLSIPDAESLPLYRMVLKLACVGISTPTRRRCGAERSRKACAWNPLNTIHSGIVRHLLRVAHPSGVGRRTWTPLRQGDEPVEQSPRCSRLRQVFHVNRGALATTRTLSRHNWEISSCPLAVPSLDEEAKADFDWDRQLPVFERTRQALVFMCTRMEKYGSVGHHFRWYLARSMRLY